MKEDLVWLYNLQRKKGLSPKLSPSWEGPCKVVQMINDVVYRIRRSPRSKIKIVYALESFKQVPCRFRRMKLSWTLRCGPVNACGLDNQTDEACRSFAWWPKVMLWRSSIIDRLSNVLEDSTTERSLEIFENFDSEASEQSELSILNANEWSIVFWIVVSWISSVIYIVVLN